MQKIKIVFILIGILSLLLFLLYYGKGKDTGNTPLYSMIKAIVSKINLRKITLRRINSGGIDVFALHFNW